MATKDGQRSLFPFGASCLCRSASRDSVLGVGAASHVSYFYFDWKYCPHDLEEHMEAIVLAPDWFGNSTIFGIHFTVLTL